MTLVELLRLSRPPELVPRYNIAPMQPVAALRSSEGREERLLEELRWGLVPSWAKDPAIGNRMINARCETAADKPAFRAAFRRRRCLIPADGFYEWRKIEGQNRKQPYYVRLREAGPFVMAGLWERWEGADGQVIESCTILTTDANELIKPLHERMPVILHPDRFDLWLDPEMTDAGALRPLLVPYPAEKMAAYAVGTRVNSPSHESSDCIEPLE